VEVHQKRLYSRKNEHALRRMSCSLTEPTGCCLHETSCFVRESSCTSGTICRARRLCLTGTRSPPSLALTPRVLAARQPILNLLKHGPLCAPCVLLDPAASRFWPAWVQEVAPPEDSFSHLRLSLFPVVAGPGQSQLNVVPCGDQVHVRIYLPLNWTLPRFPADFPCVDDKLPWAVTPFEGISVPRARRTLCQTSVSSVSGLYFLSRHARSTLRWFLPQNAARARTRQPESIAPFTLFLKHPSSDLTYGSALLLRCSLFHVVANDAVAGDDYAVRKELTRPCRNGYLGLQRGNSCCAPGCSRCDNLDGCDSTDLGDACCADKVSSEHAETDHHRSTGTTRETRARRCPLLGGRRTWTGRNVQHPQQPVRPA